MPRARLRPGVKAPASGQYESGGPIATAPATNAR